MRWRAVRIAAVIRIAAVVPLVIAMLGQATFAQPPTANARKPNVVLIIMDDIGYGDIGVYGSPDIKTPHIDRLARQGVKLTDFYAAPQCTPTRAALMIGRYQQRVSLERALDFDNVGAELAQDTRAGRARDVVGEVEHVETLEHLRLLCHV